MMEGWEACFFVLILVDLAFGKDIPVNATYIVKQIDSCPDVGYFFRRDLSPNFIGSGPCYLCFCQNNGTAICWERERERCDVEKFHHHRMGRQSRYRRSPIGFSDIFFRDASRDFFDKNLPEQCKPYESSFSDGCPPADWCIGCTVCDCDANGRWDCHILSFCDGKEKKKKTKLRKGRFNRRTIIENHSRELMTTSKTTSPTTKRTKKFVKRKRENKAQNKSNNNTIQQFKKKNTKPQKQKGLKKKPQPKRPQTKKPKQNHPNANVSKVIIIRKNLATRKPVSVQRANKRKVLNLNPNNNETVKIGRKIVKQANNNETIKIGQKIVKKTIDNETIKIGQKIVKQANINDTVKIGQKIVKQVMTAVQKLFKREMERNNATRSAKLPGKRNCEEEKKRDKRTYYVESTTTARNKKKHKRRAHKTRDYIPIRYKRDIFNEARAKIENVSVITLTPDNNAVIPLEIVKSEFSPSTNSSDFVTLASIPTLQEKYYYKYSMKNDADGTTIINPSNNATERNESDNINYVEPKNNLTNKETDNNTKTVINPDFNDLKFTKWYIIKVRKANRKKTTKQLLPKPKVSHSFKDANTTDNTYFVNTLLIKKLQTKYDVTKKPDYAKNFTRNYSRPYHYTHPPTTKYKTDVTGLNNILQNLLKEINKNDTAWKKIKPKVSIMKYVKKFFHMIFSKKRSGNHKLYGMGKKEDHALQILCEHIGSCNINKNNKLILKYKLKQLNRETETILRSIRTIKGLLRLLDLPDSDKTPYLSKKSSFKNDIQKLSVVLRDNYNIEEINGSLTYTQITQINYIKKNTETFVDSVKKLAALLNEIIALVKPKNEHDNYKESQPRTRNNTIPLHKIKKLLYKYNLIQNNFMRKMYELINGAARTTTTTERIHAQISDPKRNYTSNKIIAKYSRNIIENLRRLKNLAHALSSTRKKRSIMAGDGAIEYLLTLMEYLIKQNHPSDSAPANDGIDLLIDAIRNAPDIKPMNKTVFYSNSQTVKSNSDADLSKQITEEGNSGSKPISDEENKIEKEDKFASYDYILRDDNVIKFDNNSLQMEKSTLDIDDVTQKVYYRVFNEDKQLSNENNSSFQVEQTTSAFDDATPKVFYKLFNDNTQKHNEVIYATTTEYKSVTSSSNLDKEKTGFEKFESNIDKNKKFEIYYADMEDDGNGNSNALEGINSTIINKLIKEEQTIFPLNIPEATFMPTILRNEVNDSSFESQDSKNFSDKTKLDWIEETFDREIREFSEHNETYTTPTSTSVSTTVSDPSTPKNNENISGLTAEIEETRGRKKKTLKKTNIEDVIHQKQMTFLNSLDYGTEKSSIEEADSKDESKLDDGFPAYFI